MQSNAFEMNFGRYKVKFKLTITHQGITTKPKESEDMVNLMKSYGDDIDAAIPDQNSFSFHIHT